MDAPPDLFGRCIAVDPDEITRLVVVFDHRRGLGLVLLEAGFDRFGGVVLAAMEVAATAVANAGLFGGVLVDVVVRSTVRADAPPGQPVHEFLVAHLQIQDDVEIGDRL